MTTQHKIRGLQSLLGWPGRVRSRWRLPSMTTPEDISPLNHVAQLKGQIPGATHSEKGKWPDKDPQEIYQDLIRRFEFHRHNAEAGARSACRWSWVMALLIPMVSATVTFLSVDLGVPLPGWIVPLAGLVLTILTIFNAVTRQDHKYSTLSQKLIALNDWKFGLDIDIANKLNSSRKKEDMHRLLKEKNTRLSQIGKEMLTVFTPKPFQ